jgi:hypothetical protein
MLKYGSVYRINSFLVALTKMLQGGPPLHRCMLAAIQPMETLGRSNGAFQRISEVPQTFVNVVKQHCREGNVYQAAIFWVGQSLERCLRDSLDTRMEDKQGSPALAKVDQERFIGQVRLWWQLRHSSPWPTLVDFG